ncbi:MAG: ankyrin repeat domain-containing protein, partial [Bacteroidales bacterium]|nr:ankyrin repeat domain-containing protein [Bacteroidales bacterium]
FYLLIIFSKAMRPNPKKNLLLINAIHEGSKKLMEVEKLIEKGADVNCIEFGLSPLTLAIELGEYNICRYLISKGAYVNMPDGEGILPIEAAKTAKSKRILRYLEKAN